MRQVIGYPRLHMGLFDLGSATLRQYGGIGASLHGPETMVTAELSERSSINGIEVLDVAAGRDLDAALERLAAPHGLPPIAIRIHAVPPQHVGLGTKTTLLLSVLRAVSAEAGLAMSDADLQRASGRGGTSGIGVHSFFCGGLVVDGGHRTDPPRTYRPSSAAAPVRVPPMVGRVAMPTHWDVTLVLPPGRQRAGKDEEALFESLTPVPDAEVLETIALSVMGLAASAASEDLDSFARGLAGIHATGFKARELAAQSDPVRELFEELSSLPRCAVGMSSMGPLLFAISAESSIRDRVVDTANRSGAPVLGSVGFRNEGFDLA